MRPTRALSSRRLASAAIAAALWSGSVSGAEPKRVAIVEADPKLRHAVEVSLSAWSVVVVDAESPSLGGVMPGAANDARVVAEKARADAVVWVSREGSGYALWMYDASTDAVASRALSVPVPFDDANAASAALSVKTMLRSSAVAPAAERIAHAERQSAPYDGWLRVQLAGSAKLVAGSTLEPRVGAGVSVWPSGGHWGAAFDARLGPGVRVSSGLFDGRYTDTTLALSGRARASLGERFLLDVGVGPALHLSAIDGIAPATLSPARDTRQNLSLDLRTALDVRIGGGVTVGLDAGLAWMFRWQRYLVAGDSAFEGTPFEGEVGLRVGARIP